ncbi:hypothetical protein SO694_00059064 [Aureococcus anophagefferens]|uniref:Uncharacterized protein n=1 Tax=Aureococcus anophagefferens TaxID=44056 RepID=A0ABR1FYL1_AURAN
MADYDDPDPALFRSGNVAIGIFLDDYEFTVFDKHSNSIQDWDYITPEAILEELGGDPSRKNLKKAIRDGKRLVRISRGGARAAPDDEDRYAEPAPQRGGYRGKKKRGGYRGPREPKAKPRQNDFFSPLFGATKREARVAAGEARGAAAPLPAGKRPVGRPRSGKTKFNVGDYVFAPDAARVVWTGGVVVGVETGPRRCDDAITIVSAGGGTHVFLADSARKTSPHGGRAPVVSPSASASSLPPLSDDVSVPPLALEA